MRRSSLSVNRSALVLADRSCPLEQQLFVVSPIARTMRLKLRDQLLVECRINLNMIHHHAEVNVFEEHNLRLNPLSPVDEDYSSAVPTALQTAP